MENQQNVAEKFFFVAMANIFANKYDNRMGDPTDG